LRFKKEPPCEGFSVYELSGSGTLEEAAANLYRGLRYADEIGAKGVSCYLFDEEGIGAALNDKLRRAAAAE
jgi:L-threonylcarbamoyladenylate synthase